MILSLFGMGQFPSSDTGRSGHMWTIYSRNFVSSNLSDEVDELFLDGYGEDNDLVDQMDSDPSKGTSGASYTTEDDDYPTNSFNANLDISKEHCFRYRNGLPDDDTKPTLDTSQSPCDNRNQLQFLSSYENEKEVLNARYGAFSASESECGASRDDLMRCYGQRSDLLHCKDQVEYYSKCAKTSLNQRLLK